jgi:hypothetical protein
MTSHTRTVALTLALLAGAISPALAQHQAMPKGMTHEEHLAQMKKDADLKKRGALAMGFDQDRTAHHFLVAKDGGSIEVSVKDPADAASLAQVRLHLKQIAEEFADGNFEKPFATHAEAIPGVKAMGERRTTISYRYEETAGGGRVRISTSDGKALAAIHEFLNYQVREHGTGDPLPVKR